MTSSTPTGDKAVTPGRGIPGILRTLVIGTWYLLSTPCAALIAFPWTFISRDVTFLYNLAMKIAWAGIQLSGIRVKVLGREQIDPESAYIFMCNHVSNLDPPIILPLIPRRTSVLVKKEVFRIPVLAQAMRMGALVPVDRSNREAAIESIHRAAEVLRHGISMTVFPEGTRSKDGRLLPFKKGPFHLAIESGAPVVPMSISGTETMMKKGCWKIGTGTATVVFHTPLRPEDFPDRESLMAAVRVVIGGSLPAHMQPAT